METFRVSHLTELEGFAVQLIKSAGHDFAEGESQARRLSPLASTPPYQPTSSSR